MLNTPSLRATPADSVSIEERSYMHVIIVKNDSLASEYIQLCAEKAGFAGVCATFNTAGSALNRLRKQRAHLGIFGLTLPDMDGLDLINTVKAERLVSRILVVSGRKDELTRTRLRPGEIDGFVASDSMAASSRLADIIQRVAQGEAEFTPTSAKEIRHRPEPPLSKILTPHELHVFTVLGDGCDDKKAAERLGLSRHTVHNHRRHLMRKLGVQSRTELMVIALQRGIIRITPERIFRPGFC